MITGNTGKIGTYRNCKKPGKAEVRLKVYGQGGGGTYYGYTLGVGKQICTAAGACANTNLGRCLIYTGKKEGSNGQ